LDLLVPILRQEDFCLSGAITLNGEKVDNIDIFLQTGEYVLKVGKKILQDLKWNDRRV